MIKLDENLLVELGLADLPKEEKAAFLKHMYETLEMRVGTRLAERMSDQQMSEFEQFINSNDEQGAFKWLESNFPNYKEVVAEEFEKLKGEILPMAADILSASQAQAQQQPQQIQQQQQQPTMQPGQMPQTPQAPQATPGYPQQPLSQPQQPYAQSHFNEPHSSMPPQDLPNQQGYQPAMPAAQPQQPYAPQQTGIPQQQPQITQQADYDGQQPQASQQFNNPQATQQQYSTQQQYTDDSADNRQQPQQPGHHPQYPQNSPPQQQ